MKERPIIFSGSMVRAILKNNKSETRRIIKPQPISHHWENMPGYQLDQNMQKIGEGDYGLRRQHTLKVKKSGRVWENPEWVTCRFGRPGDILWVREKWQYWNWTEDGIPVIRYAADDEKLLKEPFDDEWGEKLMDIWAELSVNENEAARDKRWRPAIHMPRFACRLFLQVHDIHFERLQDIGIMSILHEGVLYATDTDAEEIPEDRTMKPFLRDKFAELWISINGEASWHENPWVWVVRFQRCPGLQYTNSDHS